MGRYWFTWLQIPNSPEIWLRVCLCNKKHSTCVNLATLPSGRAYMWVIPSVQHYKYSLLSPDFLIPSSFFLMNDSCINNGKNNTLQL